MRVESARGEIGRIVSIRLDCDGAIEVGHYLTSARTVWEVVQVKRAQSGKHMGRYELRARTQAEVPPGATIHAVRYDGDGRVYVAA